MPHTTPLRRTTLIIATLLAFVVGLGLGQTDIHFWWVWLFPLGVVTLLARRSRVFVVGLCAIGLCLGLWRGHASLRQFDALTRHIGQTVSLTGTISDDPATAKQTNFILTSVSLGGRQVAGDVRVTSYPQRQLKRGYVVRITGKLKAGFSSQPASLGYGQLQVLSTKQSWLEQARQAFFAGMHTAMPDPNAGFALGLLIGVRSMIPVWLQNQLNDVGLSHLVAVSGYNLTIIAAAFYTVLRPRSRYLATAVSVWLISFFIIVAGASASVVRAAVVALLVLAAKYYGRSIRPGLLLALAAAATAAWNPWLLTRDLGWQLSFLAFAGIAVVAPVLETRLFRNPGSIKKVAIESFSAQLITFPLIMLVFGRFSVIAPLANMLVLPLVPAAMGLSLVAGLSGWLWPVSATVLAWPAWFITQLMLAIITRLDTLPIVSLTAALTWTRLVIIYALGTLLIWLLARRAVTEPHAQ